MPEAKLAREAELPYAALASSTDYDCWHPSEAEVEVEHVLEVMRKNVALAAEAIRRVAGALPDPSKSPASSALKGAIMTAPDAIPKETLRARSDHRKVLSGLVIDPNQRGSSTNQS